MIYWAIFIVIMLMLAVAAYFLWSETSLDAKVKRILRARNMTKANLAKQKAKYLEKLEREASEIANDTSEVLDSTREEAAKLKDRINDLLMDRRFDFGNDKTKDGK